MNEMLMMAYDLKHQIDLLPSNIKGETKVDGGDRIVYAAADSPNNNFN